MFGPLAKPALRGMLDLDRREAVTLMPLAALTVLFGIYPAPVMDLYAASIGGLMTELASGLAAAKPLAALAP
jgi:NADH-quinone oxidoreductase subunit M